MAHIRAFDDVNNLLRHVLGMITDALDRFSNPQDLKCSVIVRGSSIMNVMS